MPMATSSSSQSQFEESAIGSGKKLMWKSVDLTEDVRPSAREGHCSCVVGSSLYIFGGVSIGTGDDVHEKDDLWQYDMNACKWTLVECEESVEKPISRSAATMVSVGSKFYLFGGLNHSVGWLDDMFVFDTENMCWVEEEYSGTGPSSRDKLSSAVVGQDIWYFGGFGPQLTTKGPLDLEDEDDISSDDEIQQLEAQQQAAQFGWFDDLHVYNTQTKSWSQPIQMSMGKPSPRCAATMIAHNNTLVIFGGRDAEGRLNDLHFFDTMTKKWMKNRKIEGISPEYRSFHAATLTSNNTMLVAGGRGVDNQHFSDLHLFNLDSNTWTKLDSAGFTARGCHTLNSLDNKVMIFGGSSSFNQSQQHCETYHGDLLVATITPTSDSEGSPNKVRKVE